MGVVYEATQLSLNRKVALKLLAPHLSDDVGFRERFRREGQIQGRIDHPYIIPVYEAGDSAEGLFLAMRLVRGPNLKHMIRQGEVDPGRAVRLLTPIASALDAAHEEGLIHRDIKPQNILVARRDHPYLADFGLTKGAGERTLTQTGQFVGTLYYVSPEQIQGESVGPASDLYALAAVLYECLTGFVPYPKDSEAALIYAHLSEPPPRVSVMCPDVPAALDDVIGRALAKDPDERHASATELMDDAAHVLAGGAPRPRSGRSSGAVSSPAGDALRETVPARPGLAAAGIAEATPPGATPVTPATVSAGRASAAPEAAAGPTWLELNRRTLWAIGAVVLAAVSVAGLFVGRSGNKEETQAAANLATSSSLELSFPSSWQRAEQQLRVPGVDFEDPLVLAPRGAPEGDGLVAGQVSASGPSLIPAGLRTRLPDPVKRDDAVKLQDLQAYRYRNLKPRGFDKALTIFVVPNTGGVATVACIDSSKGSAAVTPACERIADSLRLVSDEAYPLGPDPDYGERLSVVVAKLNSTRIAGRRSLSSATTPAGQEKAALALRTSYREASQSLTRTAVGPADEPVNAALARLAARAASAYENLAAAARGGNRARYRRAGAAIRKAEKDFARTLQRLERRGYRLG